MSDSNEIFPFLPELLRENNTIGIRKKSQNANPEYLFNDVPTELHDNDVNVSSIFLMEGEDYREEESLFSYSTPFESRTDVTCLLRFVSSFGVGILTLPTVLNQLGGSLGLGLISIMAPITTYPAAFIYKAVDMQQGPCAKSYWHMFKISGYSKFWQDCVACVSILSVVMMNATYFLGLVEALSSFTNEWITICKITWGLICSLVLFPVVWIRSLKKFRLLFIIDTFLYFTVIAMTILYIGADIDQRDYDVPTVEVEHNVTWYTFFNSLSLVVFAYSNTYSYIEIISNIELHTYSKYCTFLAAFAQMGIYMLYAGANYYYFGKRMPGSFLAKIPGFDVPYRICTVLIAIHMYMMYGSRSVKATQNLHSFIWPETAMLDTNQSRRRSVMISISILIFSFIIAMIIPRLQEIASLIGSIIVPWMEFIIPIFFLRGQYRVSRISHLTETEAIIGLFYIAFGLVLFFMGTAGNIVTLGMEQYQGEFFHPFSCLTSPVFLVF